MWGKTKGGQAYIKFKKPVGLSGKGQKTEATHDIHYRERDSNPTIMDEFRDAEVIVPVPELGIWMVWFGGESHYVHIYNQEGVETDVFSWGFEKNKLDAQDVRKHIKEKIEELSKEENRF